MALHRQADLDRMQCSQIHGEGWPVSRFRSPNFNCNIQLFDSNPKIQSKVA